MRNLAYFLKRIKNPNLYVTLAASENNGYLLQESGQLIFLENGDGLFF